MKGISVRNMKRIPVRNMKTIYVRNMKSTYFCQKYEENFCQKYEGNSIIPDMSFRPHLLNDLRGQEKSRGMSKESAIFCLFGREMNFESNILDFTFFE